MGTAQHPLMGVLAGALKVVPRAQWRPRLSLARAMGELPE